MKEEPMTRVTLEDVQKLKTQTDWNRLRQEDAAGIEPLDDVEIDNGDWDWENATVTMPKPKQAISLRVDPDVLEFFKSQGKGYQTRMNAVLRSYMDAKLKG